MKIVFQKRPVAVVAMFLASFCVFSSVLSGSDLLVSSSEHFDFIFNSESAASAQYLYDRAEDIYSCLAGIYGAEPTSSSFDDNAVFRIPVVVTPDVQVLNAYFTSYPQNRIVMYDTVCEVGSLSNLEEGLADIFKHELTHCFQFNFRTGFWDDVSAIFGDNVSPAPFLYLYPALIEGGAVMTESLSGYGRANDMSALQLVKQAKLEGVFPSFADIAGARDINPTGDLYYNFAGSFLFFVQQEYGLENLSALYRDFAGLHWNLSRGLFSRHMGVSLEDAWKEFESSVPVPDSWILPETVIEEDGSYSTLTAFGNEIYAVDASRSEVFPLSDPDEPLFHFVSYSRWLSADELGEGLVFLVPDVDQNVSSMRLVSPDGSFLGDIVLEYEDARMGCLARLDGKNVVVLISSCGQISTVSVCSAVESTILDGKTLELPYGVTWSCPVSVSDGLVAFVESHGASQNIVLLDLATMSATRFSSPDGIEIRSLSACITSEGACLPFTCLPDVDDGSLASYGELHLVFPEDSPVRGYYLVSDTDVLGGIWSPILLEDEVYFQSRYYDHSTISRLDRGCLEPFDKLDAPSEPVIYVADTPDPSPILASAVKYRPVDFMKRGVLLPVGDATVSASGDSLFLVGIEYLLEDPTETHELGIQAYTGNLATGFGLSYMNTSVVPFSLGLGASFNSYSSVLSVSAEIAPAVTLGRIGENLCFDCRVDFSFDGFELSPGIGLDILYLNSISRGRGYYDSFSFLADAYLSWDGNLAYGVLLDVKIPSLVPASLTLDLGTDYMGFRMKGRLQLIPFSLEIQKGMRFLGFYAQRFYTKMQLDCFWLPSDGSAFSFAAVAGLSLSPLLGDYLTQTRFGLEARLGYSAAAGLSFTIALGSCDLN